MSPKANCKKVTELCVLSLLKYQIKDEFNWSKDEWKI